MSYACFLHGAHHGHAVCSWLAQSNKASRSGGSGERVCRDEEGLCTHASLPSEVHAPVLPCLRAMYSTGFRQPGSKFAAVNSSPHTLCRDSILLQGMKLGIRFPRI